MKLKAEQKEPDGNRVTEAEIVEFLERIGPQLNPEDQTFLEKIVKTLASLTRSIDEKGMTITRLRKMLFGKKSEKLSKVLDLDEQRMPGSGSSVEGGQDGSRSKGPEEGGGDGPPEKKKAKGHGRNGSDLYTGAEHIHIPHETLKHGDPCPMPKCKGRVYELPPRTFVWLEGGPPIGCKVITLGTLRCNAQKCGTVFTARLPEGIGPDKYDATAATTIALLRYLFGLPFNRLEDMQACFGIPLPASTQWDVVEAAFEMIKPAYDQLELEAADGDVLYNDDTSMTVLEIMKENKERKEAKEGELGTG